jgi:hypothetical protein
MRLTLLVVALVSCVFLTTERADAPDGQTRSAEEQVVKAKTTKPAKAKAKPTPKEDDEPVVRDDDDEPKAKKAPPPKKTTRTVGQATDDEVPRNEKPAKKR